MKFHKFSKFKDFISFIIVLTAAIFILQSRLKLIMKYQLKMYSFNESGFFVSVAIRFDNQL
jgi:hypothetical protein